MNNPVPGSNRFLPVLSFLCVVVFLQGCVSSEEAERFGIMTFNIRYDNPDDGAHRWDLRKDWVAEIIRLQSPDIVGVQEALRHQLDSLAVRLPLYQWTGLGRSDGVNKGEFSPIFFRSDRLLLQDEGTFWLSPHPDSVGSVGWDAALPRIVTWAKFLDLKTKQYLFAFNTHFDHRGQQAREESAALIRRRVVDIAGSTTFVLTGDFNIEDSNPAYEVLISDFGDGFLVSDSRIASRSEDLGTFRGFEIGAAEARRIDYIFLSPGLTPDSHLVLDEDRNGSYPSDHLPVYVSASVSED